ncbi:MAG TPA: acyloxyacyl hydrolase [Candidatus Acidoferrum sp.]|nr:acyloxyacyl hydrolase [Candidatus Acidoferrum sp.]
MLLIMAGGALTCSSAAAQTNSPPPEKFATLFSPGSWEGSVDAGVLFSPVIATYQRPTINYTITSLQVGRMLSEVKGSGWLRGNFEFAGEGFGSAIFQGPGGYIAGVTLWARYNFVQRDWRFIPYVQAGAGLTATDINRGIVGQTFQFNLDIAAGTRYFLAQRWCLNLECRYQHVSNANTGKHNLGINAIGPLLGVSYFF